jgi:hypothetical protein
MLTHKIDCTLDHKWINKLFLTIMCYNKRDHYFGYCLSFGPPPPFQNSVPDTGFIEVVR